MRLSKLLSAFLLIAYTIAASAQEYSHARYDVKDGLAGTVVYCGAEDKEGFLWFGTETGLSRFDGTHFRNFTTADGLPDNEILRLFIDSKNRVWMRPFRNAICYYWKGKIHNQENDSLLSKLTPRSEIVDIIEDSRGNILIAETRAFHIITPARKIITIRDDQDRPLIIVKAGIRYDGRFAMLSNGNGGHVSTLTLDPETFAIQEESTNYDQGYLHLTWLSPTLDIYTRTDSLHFVYAAGKRQSTYPQVNVTGLSPLNDSLCAINTANGARLFNYRTGLVTRVCMPGKIINGTMLDSEGSFWFMTAGSGIYRIGSFEFINFIFNAKNKDALPVFSIQKAESQLYVGTERSILWKIDMRTYKTEHQYLFNEATHARILSMTPLPGSKMILGTDYGLIGIDGKNLRFSSVRDISIKSVSAHDHHLIVSANGGVYDMSGSLIFPQPVWYGRSTASYMLHEVVYVGALSGLFVADSTPNGRFLGNRFPLFNSRITALNASADGTLWVATNGNGLIGFRNNRITHVIGQQDGLTSNICRTLFVSDHDIWVGTDKGLNRVNMASGSPHITTYSSGDGLIGDIINTVFVDGTRVYAGTPSGLTSFDADKISMNSWCKLRITNIHNAGRELIADTTRFILPSSNNAIRFDFAGISYRSAGDITYRYRLTGLDDNWQTTRETFLSYPSLPSGDYELQLVATNKYGVQSEEVHISFRVEKPLWEKAWFRVLALVIAWALIWVFVSARIKRIRRQNDASLQINNRMAELEQMALKAQMNPHFIFNSLNSVQQYVINKDLPGANKFITEFSRLIRLTLDLSSKSRVSIREEINYLSTYLELEKTKFEDKFSYSVEVAPGIDPGTWFIPPMILQPYVENAIRHGVRYRHDKEGHVKILVSRNEQYLICQVEDNGVGRKVSGQYKSKIPIEYQSKGMTLTAKRIEMLNKTLPAPVLIDIEDLEEGGQAIGTRVTLLFPLQATRSVQ